MNGLLERAAMLARSSKLGVLAVALALGAMGGWAFSTTFVKNATAFERAYDEGRASPERIKVALVGSYSVTGTDPHGERYESPRVLGISLAPSGALELEWDDGKVVGVGQLIDNNVLAIAWLNKGRTVVSVMTINPDATLSGNWFRRTDRGAKATETWKKI
jgi:hypothetical protein